MDSHTNKETTIYSSSFEFCRACAVHALFLFISPWLGFSLVCQWLVLFWSLCKLWFSTWDDRLTVKLNRVCDCLYLSCLCIFFIFYDVLNEVLLAILPACFEFCRVVSVHALFLVYKPMTQLNHFLHPIEHEIHIVVYLICIILLQIFS